MAIDLKEFFIHALKEETSGAGPLYKGTPTVKTDPAAGGAVPGTTPNPAGDGQSIVQYEEPDALTFFRNQVAGLVQSFGDLGIDAAGLEQTAAALDGVVYNFYRASPNPFKFKTSWQTLAAKWGEQTADMLKSIGELRNSK